MLKTANKIKVPHRFTGQNHQMGGIPTDSSSKACRTSDELEKLVQRIGSYWLVSGEVSSRDEPSKYDVTWSSRRSLPVEFN